MAVPGSQAAILSTLPVELDKTVLLSNALRNLLAIFRENEHVLSNHCMFNRSDMNMVLV